MLRVCSPALIIQSRHSGAAYRFLRVVILAVEHSRQKKDYLCRLPMSEEVVELEYQHCCMFNLSPREILVYPSFLYFGAFLA